MHVSAGITVKILQLMGRVETEYCPNVLDLWVFSPQMYESLKPIYRGNYLVNIHVPRYSDGLVNGSTFGHNCTFVCQVVDFKF